MNLQSIERVIVPAVRAALGSSVDVRAGPVLPLPLGGMRETVFVHAAHFQDHRGLAADGARIGRQPYRKGRVAGIREQRPAHIVVEVTIIAAAMAPVQDLSHKLSPAVLLALIAENGFQVGQSANALVGLVFADFAATIDRTESLYQRDGDIGVFMQRLEFRLEGDLHVLISRQDGFGTPTATPAGSVAGPPEGGTRPAPAGRSAGTKKATRKRSKKKAAPT